MQNSLERTVATLMEWFEPSQKMRNQAELQTRRKKKTESWADLAVADKAYTNLEDKAEKDSSLYDK